MWLMIPPWVAFVYADGAEKTLVCAWSCVVAVMGLVLGVGVMGCCCGRLCVAGDEVWLRLFVSTVRKGCWVVGGGSRFWGLEEAWGGPDHACRFPDPQHGLSVRSRYTRP